MVQGAWAHFLADYPDRIFLESLLHVIDYGAAIGYTGPYPSSPNCANLKTALEHPEVIESDINTLASNGRIQGPFTNSPHPFFHVSPLSTVSKKRNPNKHRVINHLSWPAGSSVNDGIPDSEASIIYESITYTINTIRCSGRGSLLAKHDLKDTFRHIPLNHRDRFLIGCNWHGELYDYMVLIFGLHSAPYIFNLFAEALHWIIQRHIPALIKHYLDNFLTIFPPATTPHIATAATEWVQGLGTVLGLTFQPDKTVWPIITLEFLGNELDTLAMEARLPEDKLTYLRDLLTAWHAKKTCSLTQLQELIGFLYFASQVIPYSRTFLR